MPGLSSAELMRRYGGCAPPNYPMQDTWLVYIDGDMHFCRRCSKPLWGGEQVRFLLLWYALGNKPIGMYVCRDYRACERRRKEQG